MDLITLLRNDHRRIIRLLKQARDARAADQRRSLFDRAGAEIRAHERVEEKMIYSRLKRYAHERDVVLEAHETHLIVARLVREIEDLPPADERWAAKLNVLLDLAERHIKEEHDTIFPQAADLFDEAELDRMGTRVKSLFGPLAA